MSCNKRRIGDEYHCPTCRTRWDTNDPEPPACDAEQSRPITLTERLRALNNRMRQATVLPSLCNDLEDLIEEVALIEQAAKRSKATTGSGPNVVPIR